MAQPRTWIVGNHELVFEPPDTFWADISGWITHDDGVRWVDIMRDVSAKGPVYCVVRMKPMKDYPQPRLSTEARQYLAKHSSSDWFMAMVFVGGGLFQKITAKGVALAMLLSGQRRFDTKFVESEEEAQAWIAEHRAAARR